MEKSKVVCPYCGNARFNLEDTQQEETAFVYWRATCLICGATGPWTITRLDALQKVTVLQKTYIEALDALRALRSVREELRDLVTKKLDAFD